jgi:threonylcarbamoyladenosine tRNA methylthiotransferase MtaB
MLKIPGFRLRISSIDPRDLDQQLIETILHNPQIASHFHIPLQSGSTRILHLMNRLYDANTFTNFVKMIHKIDPTATVTTDVICGFPGETENDFDETFQRINSLPIFDLHVFPFSPRPGTPAFDFTDQVEDSIKKARVERLLKLKPIKRAEHFSRNLGLQKSVLIEKTENGQSFGLTDNYLPVQIAQSHTPGTMLTVTLTAGSAEHLIGIPCEI